MSNVLFLFGINGVGKSTLARSITARRPGSVSIGSSEILRSAFGHVSRKELERANPATKHRALRDALELAFQRHRDAPLIVCDAHLTVVIGDGGGQRYERMWDQSLGRYAAAFVCVTAPLQKVIDRRKADMKTGRNRNLCPSLAADHAAMELREHLLRFGGSPLARVIANDGSVAAAVKRLEDLITCAKS
jgi:adenylate kinase